jgi:DNA-binding winged helix-turn-helix (wHTH) protein/Tfp pilus assembly protein PilF
MASLTKTPERAAASSQPASQSINRLRFAEFEVDFAERQLWKDGRPVKIQKKPFDILRLLLERPGALVTRTRIQQTLWPELHVSYERSLNTAVNALREALGDSGRSFRFIETTSGAGYRFVAKTEPVGHILEKPAAPPGAAAESARRDYLTGNFFYSKMSEEGLTTATAHFSAAIEQDPSFALPYAGLAQVQNLFAFWGIYPARESGRRAEEYARSAIWLASDQAEPYVAMAGVKRVAEWDWNGAERLYQRALELDPDCEQAHIWYADLLLCRGRAAEAVIHTEAVLASDPLSQWGCFQRAWALFVTGEYRSAMEQVWHALVLDPNFGLGHFLLGLIYQQMEMIDEATAELETARLKSPIHPIVLSALGYLHATTGSHEKAKDLLEELTDLSDRRYVSPYCFALLQAGLGKRDACMGEFERAFEEKDILLQWVFVDPRVSALRASDARLAFLLSRVGLQSGSAPKF